MKLFSDMTPFEKLEHIQRSIGEAEDQVRAKISRLDHADEALNLFDDWLPYMLNRLWKLETVVALQKARKAAESE